MSTYDITGARTDGRGWAEMRLSGHRNVWGMPSLRWAGTIRSVSTEDIAGKYLLTSSYGFLRMCLVTIC